MSELLDKGHASVAAGSFFKQTFNAIKLREAVELISRKVAKTQRILSFYFAVLAALREKKSKRSCGDVNHPILLILKF
jgi:hypothetical protein